MLSYCVRSTFPARVVRFPAKSHDRDGFQLRAVLSLHFISMVKTLQCLPNVLRYNNMNRARLASTMQVGGVSVGRKKGSLLMDGQLACSRGEAQKLGSRGHASNLAGRAGVGVLAVDVTRVTGLSLLQGSEGFAGNSQRCCICRVAGMPALQFEASSMQVSNGKGTHGTCESTVASVSIETS